VLIRVRTTWQCREGGCSIRPRHPQILIASAVSALLFGCSVTAKQYWKNRAHDALDIVDFDIGQGPGLGAKVELTNYLAPALGIAETQETVKRGRNIDKREPGGLASLGLVGVEGTNCCNAQYYVAGVLATPAAHELKDNFRVGPKLYLGCCSAGFFLNFAELADFFRGFTGRDLCGDDRAPPADELVVESWRRNPATHEWLFPERSSVVFAIQHGHEEDTGLLRYTKLVVESYIRSRGPSDEVGLLAFDTFKTERFPTVGGLQACDAAGKQALLTALDSIVPTAGSPLMRGIPAAIEMARASKSAHPTIVLMLNGAANGSDENADSSFKVQEHILTALNAGVAEIHVVLYGADRLATVHAFLQNLAAHNQGRVVRIAERTLAKG
jgi:hypothetical protein